MSRRALHLLARRPLSPRPVPNSNALYLRRDSWHCGQWRVLGAAAPRLMCVLIHKIDTWDLKGDPSDRFYLFLPRMRPALLALYPLQLCSPNMPLSRRATEVYGLSEAVAAARVRQSMLAQTRPVCGGNRTFRSCRSSMAVDGRDYVFAAMPGS